MKVNRQKVKVNLNTKLKPIKKVKVERTSYYYNPYNPEIGNKNYLDNKGKVKNSKKNEIKSDIFFLKNEKYKYSPEKKVKIQKCTQNYNKLRAEKKERTHKNFVNPESHVGFINGTFTSSKQNITYHRIPLENKIVTKRKDADIPFKMKIYEQYHNSSGLKKSFADNFGGQREHSQKCRTRRNYYNPESRKDLLDETSKTIKPLTKYDSFQRKMKLHNQTKKLFPDYDESTYNYSFLPSNDYGSNILNTEGRIFSSNKKKNHDVSGVLPYDTIKVNRRENTSAETRNRFKEISRNRNLFSNTRRSMYDKYPNKLTIDSLCYDIKDRKFSANKDNISGIFNSQVYAETEVPKISEKITKDSFRDISAYAKENKIARDCYNKTGFIV